MAITIDELVEEVVSKFHNLNMLVDEKLIDEFREYIHESYEMGYQRGYDVGYQRGYAQATRKWLPDKADDYNQERI